MTGPTLPPQGWTPPPLAGGYAPPAPLTGVQPLVAQPAPVQTPSTPPRRTRWWVLAAVAIVVIGLAAAALLAWNRGVFGGTSPTEGPIQPAELETGGDLGTAVELRTASGTASVLARLARWSPEGELEPEAGTAYLVVDVEVTGVTGEVPVGALFTLAITADGQRFPIAFGPDVDGQLASALLHPGEVASGQLGFQVPAGAVEVTFLDQTGIPMGAVRIPGP